MTRVIGIVFAFVVAVFTATAALAADWIVSRSSGEIFVQQAVQKVSLTGGMRLSPGSVLVSTSGRAMLVRGDQTMIVAPNTIVGLPADATDGFTTIVQRAGTVEFTVDKRKVQHFGVETPYLAAVVKGTHFVVSAASRSATVSVERGKVEVTDLATGQRHLVLPGQKAVANGRGLKVIGSDIPNTQVAPRKPMVPPYDGSMRAENPLGFALAGVGGIVGGTVATIDGVATGNVALSTNGGVSTSIGGSDGLNASVGGGDGVSASLGGSGGVSVGVGGGNGVSVGIGGLSIGLH